MLINKMKELYLKNKLKNVTLENFDDFEDEIFYYLNIEDIEQKYINQAKKFDGENYMLSCFRYLIIYDTEKQQYIAGILEYITENDGIQEMDYLKEMEIRILGEIIEKERKSKGW